MNQNPRNQGETKDSTPPFPPTSRGQPPALEIEESGRLSWDEYFMGIAEMVARRSTCPRKRVGAVIVKGHMILSTGYNGSIRGIDRKSVV